MAGTLSVYIYEPPMNKRIYTAPIDELVDLGIDTITYAVGDCRVLPYDTQAGERWGHNIWYRAALNLGQFIADGYDPLHVVCERAHELGFNFMPSLILGMQHHDPAEATDCRCSNFCFEPPEYQVGPEPGFPEARWDDPTRFSYAIPEVRQNRLSVIEELVFSYESNGIELNLNDHTSFLARREISAHTDTFTQFVADVRHPCDLAGVEQNRKKWLLVRAGASLAGCRSLEIDMERMIREEIVDTVLAVPPHSLGLMEQYPTGIVELVEAAHGTSVKIVSGISTTIAHDAFRKATREMLVAQAANGYCAGAQGYYPSGYPYVNADFENLRYMGHPQLLAHKDKHFAVRQGPNGPEDMPGDYLSPNPLPVELKVGERGARQTLYVSDDLAVKKERDELSKCELRIRLTELIHTDTFDLWFNDQPIPPLTMNESTGLTRCGPRRAISGSLTPTGSP